MYLRSVSWSNTVQWAHPLLVYPLQLVPGKASGLTTARCSLAQRRAQNHSTLAQGMIYPLVCCYCNGFNRHMQQIVVAYWCTMQKAVLTSMLQSQGTGQLHAPCTHSWIIMELKTFSLYAWITQWINTVKLLEQPTSSRGCSAQITKYLKCN